MKYEVLDTEKGSIAIVNELEKQIESSSDFLDIMMSIDAETFVLKKVFLTDDFFELRTGIAGEMLQKVINYRRRLVIIGDFHNISSKALRDFIYESNKAGKIIFHEDMQQAVSLLK
ncbi:MAG: DUF4180 domain-containing protein [Bacillota bacterium]